MTTTPAITIEALLLSRERMTGIERYAFETISRCDAGSYRLVLGGDSGPTRALFRTAVDRTWEVVRVRNTSPLLAQVELGWRLRPLSSGIHHFSLAPGPSTTRAPFSATVYDAGAWRYPQFMSRGMRMLYRPLLERALRSPWLRGVVTISQFSKSEIVDLFDIRPEKIHVIYPSLSPTFDNRGDNRTEVVEPQRPYLLHVGTIEPRKNIELILHAYQKADLRDVPLYMVGRQGWSTPLPAVRGVKYLGAVDDATLWGLYQQCAALISASHYEGFGLTLAEGMSAGATVYAHDIAVYRELYGGHPNATFFRTVDDLVELFRDPPLRHRAGFRMPTGSTFDQAAAAMFPR